MIVSLAEGVPAALETLRSGGPVVVPLPSPLAYGVAGPSMAAVNGAKGRPAGQPLGVAIADFDALTGHLAVGRETYELITWLCCDQKINVFAPLADRAPDWMVQDPAATGGYVGLFGAWLPELRPVLDHHGHLYVSSANRTGNESATTAAEADAAFDGTCVVIDGDPVRDPHLRHGSASIVRVESDGALSLARHGINDLDARGRPTADDVFLAHLRRAWDAVSR